MKEFNFYATPLGPWQFLIVGLVSGIIGLIVCLKVFSPTHGVDRYFILHNILCCSLSLIVCYGAFIRKKRIEITGNGIFRQYSSGKLAYENNIDSLYYILAAGTYDRIDVLTFVFNDKKIDFNLLKTHAVPFFYKDGQFEEILKYCQSKYKLEKHVHYYVKGRPSKSFAYWNPQKSNQYKEYCEKYKIQEK